MPNVFLFNSVYQELPTSIVSQRAAEIRKKIVQNVVSAKFKMAVSLDEYAATIDLHENTWKSLKTQIYMTEKVEHHIAHKVLQLLYCKF